MCSCLLLSFYHFQLSFYCLLLLFLLLSLFFLLVFIILYCHFGISAYFLSLCFNPTFALTSSLFAGITLWVSVFYPLSKTLCVFEKKQNEKDGKTEGAGQTKNNKKNN